MWSKAAAYAASMLVAAACLAGASLAADEEGCLFCHRNALVKGGASGESCLKVSDPSGGPHGVLYCSDCHSDAKTVPHAVPPGPATCIGGCHAPDRGAEAAHRRAAYGGSTEYHRAVSAPHAPCRLCHKAGDRSGDGNSPAARCAGCHPAERDAVASGVHGRLRVEGGKGPCGGCHKVHPTEPEGSGAAAPNCLGRECHKSLTPGMKRLGGHDRGRRSGPGRAAAAGTFFAVVAAGWLSGRFLGGGGRPGSGGT